jgi:hypothetical protein
MDPTSRSTAVPPPRPGLAPRTTTWTTAKSYLTLLSLDPEFDPERYHYSRPVLTRLATRRYTSRPRLTRRNRPYFGPDTSVYDSFSTIDTRASRHSAGRRQDERLARKPSNASSVYSTDTSEEEPYHVFSPRRKWMVIAMVGFAGVFSGISSNMYFPALDQIATTLNVSTNDVNLSITSYLVMQGVAPVVWSAYADRIGRRPIYIASFVVYLASNVMLSFSPNFAVLVVGRAVQAAGSASTVSIGELLLRGLIGANGVGVGRKWIGMLRTNRERRHAGHCITSGTGRLHQFLPSKYVASLLSVLLIFAHTLDSQSATSPSPAVPS